MRRMGVHGLDATGQADGLFLQTSGEQAVWGSAPSGGGGGSSATAVSVWRNTTQAIASNTATPISFTTETSDTSGFFDLATPTRVVIPSGLGGLYLLAAQITYDGLTGGSQRSTLLRLNGSAWLTYSMAVPPAGTVSGVSVSGNRVVPLAAGDYIEMCAFSGAAAANVRGSATEPFTFLSVIRLG